MKFSALAIVLCAVTAGAAVSRAAVTSTFDRPAGRWTLRNGVAQAIFEFDPDGTFTFTRFEDATTGENWEPAPGTSSPIRLVLNGETLDAGTNFKLVSESARAIARNGYRQTITLDDVRGRGRVILELEMYEDQPVLRYRVRYRNTRVDRVTVQGADLLPWNFDAGGHTFRAFRVNQWVKMGKQGNFETLSSTLAPGGTGISLATGAYGQHCAWLALRDEADRGLVAGLEFDGRANWSVRNASGALSLSAQIQQLNRPLAPKEEFAGAFGFIGLFHGDWDDAGWATQRFTEAATAQRAPENFPYVVWDSWKYQTGIDDATLRRNAEIAASIGVEVFVVDLGWARQIGEWYEDPRKFSYSGLRSLSDYVHFLGMKFGLHFAFAEAAATAPVLRAHPDWRSSEDYGYFDADSLCLSHTPVRDWVIAEAGRIIEDYRVDWILQDGENMVKRCTKATHTHDPQDSNYANAVDGLNYVVSAAQRAHPATRWENCEDGGNMMTFNMVRNYVTSIAADDSGPLTTRQAIFGITYPFSPRYADRYMPDEELGLYATRSFMFGGPWIFMNRLELMRQEDLELAAREVALYKRLRTRIRQGRVFHLTGRPSETGIDAIESYHPATGAALVFVYRAQATAASRTLKLRGLDPEKRYRVHYEDDVREGVYTGAQLMKGYTVRMPGMWSTQLVYVDPVE